MVGKLRVERIERERADDLFAQQQPVHGIDRSRKLDRKLVEKRALKRPANAGNPLKRGESEMGLRQILFGHFAQTFLSKERQVHGRSQSAKSLIRANVRRGLFTPDVLLASSERQYESTPATRVVCLPRKTSRHLPNEFFVRCNPPDKRPAITGREAKALAFHRDDVGLNRWPHNTE